MLVNLLVAPIGLPWVLGSEWMTLQPPLVPFAFSGALQLLALSLQIAIYRRRVPDKEMTLEAASEKKQRA